MSVLPYEIRPEMRRRHQRAWLVFIAAASLLPICFIIGGIATRPDARSLADGPEGAWFHPLAAIMMLLSFLGTIGVPFLYAQTLERKVSFAIFATLFYFANLFVSLMVIESAFGIILD